MNSHIIKYQQYTINKNPSMWKLKIAYSLGWHNGGFHRPNPFNISTNRLMFNEFVRGYRAARAFLEHEASMVNRIALPNE